jgi:hypothetical protein
MSAKYYKWPLNISTMSNLRPSKINPNRYFWFDNKPSGYPAARSQPMVLCAPGIMSLFSNLVIAPQQKSKHWQLRLFDLENRVARSYIFKLKLRILVNFGGPYNGKCRYILWLFGIFYMYGHLVYFMTIRNVALIWYIFPRFGILCQEKSGNTA